MEMEEDRRTKISKSLSYILRHRPDSIGIVIGKDGWVDVKSLIEKAATKGKFVFDLDELKEVVETCVKQRFSFSDDFSSIKANQGHTVDVEIKFKEIAAPPILYHGTVDKFMDSIKKKGLIPGNRHHVHLSKDEVTAIDVGKRRGYPVILEINSRKMQDDSFKFYISDNGVFLTDIVPPEYITIQKK